MASSGRGSNKSSSSEGESTALCHGVTFLKSHKSIMGYESPHTQFFKVTVAMPSLIPKLKTIMESGIDLPGVDADQNSAYGEKGLLSTMYQAYECNVPFVLRFMIDRQISGAGWLTFPKGSYSIRHASEKQTHCQVSVYNANEFVASMVRSLMLSRLRLTLFTTKSLLASLRVNGTRLHPCASCPLISSVKVVKVIFLKLRRIQ